MDELSGTENRIAVERMRYNERVQEYNTLRRRFPSNITATLFGFKEYPFFQAPPEAKAGAEGGFRTSSNRQPPHPLRRGHSFCNTSAEARCRMRQWPGDPYPLGATWDGVGVNFAIFSEHATRVELCLFDSADAKRSPRASG